MGPRVEAGSRRRPIDVRVITTTNRDLAAWVERGQFREDLQYRLNVINLTLPLRERPGDIELLAHHFLGKFTAENGKPAQAISEAAMTWLKIQEWRGESEGVEEQPGSGRFSSPRTTPWIWLIFPPPRVWPKSRIAGGWKSPLSVSRIWNRR